MRTSAEGRQITIFRGQGQETRAYEKYIYPLNSSENSYGYGSCGATEGDERDQGNKGEGRQGATLLSKPGIITIVLAIAMNLPRVIAEFFHP